MDRIRVAVIIGGRSNEHSISCISARSIVAALDPGRYDVSVVGISKGGRWVQDAERGLGILDDRGRLPEVSALAPDVAVADALDVDVVFPVLHGPWGEDGTIQGLLETLGVPYVGSGVLGSALAMDKGSMKAALAAAGLLVGAFVVITDREWRTDPRAAMQRVERLGLPVFVKPSRGGSSLGITKVHDSDALIEAIEAARKHDPRVIVEAAISDAREVECGVLVDADGTPKASRCAEIIVDDAHEFYDFEAKYLDDSARLIVPAELDRKVEKAVRDLAVAAFEALCCSGLARADFFIRDDDSIVINEVNTMPGFTSISMYPRMWAATGVDYADLVNRLVADALRKGVGLS